ncbi:MAG: choice-of-anchor B family protein [Bacteroidota bacterium]
MKNVILLCFACLLALNISAQLNTTFIGQLDYDQSVNDVWAWVDEDGTEYALVGTQTGVSVVSLANPNNPVEVDFAPGPSSGWRDMKTWKDHAYAINETGDGLLVMDLSTLPDSISYSYWSPTIEELGILNTCHNLYIDNGIAYLSGCNLNSGGVIFADVDTDPNNPIYIGKADARYSHDVYVRDQMMYSSDIFAGVLSITDLSDLDEPRLMATQRTPFTFTHNAWLSDDSQTIFTTDERSNAPVAAYDISDLDNIQLLDEFRPQATLNTGVIPHNVHVLNDFLVISHYSDGLVVVDAARPHNLVEVANYDTFTGDGTGFSGAWGATPFLPSGLVLVSDRSSGLFVIETDYVRAAYLEGVVTNSDNGNLLNDVEVVISFSEGNSMETTDLAGSFATGTAEAGTYEVTFSKLGFRSKTIEVNLMNGELTELEVELSPSIRIIFEGSVVGEDDQMPISDAQVMVVSDQISYTTVTNTDGSFFLDDVIEGDYQVIVGAWGYQAVLAELDASSNQELDFELEIGYEDDFALDFGWEIVAGAASGNWERGEPIGTGTPPNYVNPEFDLDDDLGDQCYMTGNGGMNGGFDDVDNGVTILTSPIMDLNIYQSPILNYSTWFLVGGGDGRPNDTLKVKLTNGSETIILQQISIGLPRWRSSPSFELKNLIELTDQMQVIFEISDLEESGHLVEAAVDGFVVTEGDTNVNTASIIRPAISFEVYPNPFKDFIQIETDLSTAQQATLELYDNQARRLYEIRLALSPQQKIELPSILPSGTYWLNLLVDGEQAAIQTIVKQ